MSKNTAVEYLIKEISDILGPIETNPTQDLLMADAFLKAKELEREQHGRTWSAAIQTHEQRGHVFIRSICDFDDYKIS